MSPRLFNVYMDGVVREVYVRVLAKMLEMLRANGRRFGMNQLLFASDTALVADLESCVGWCASLVEYVKEKSCVNVGKSKVMRCLRYGNGGRMHVILSY